MSSLRDKLLARQKGLSAKANSRKGDGGKQKQGGLASLKRKFDKQSHSGKPTKKARSNNRRQANVPTKKKTREELVAQLEALKNKTRLSTGSHAQRSGADSSSQDGPQRRKGGRANVPQKILELNDSLIELTRKKELVAAAAKFDVARSMGDDNVNNFSYTILMNGYVQGGMLVPALDLFNDMKQHGLEVTVVAYTAMINGYCKQGRITEALALLPEMNEAKVTPNLRTVNTILRGCLVAGSVKEALNVRVQMKRWQIAPDGSTYEYLCALLCQALDLKGAKALLKEIPEELKEVNAAYYVHCVRLAALLGKKKLCLQWMEAAKRVLREVDAETMTTETMAAASGYSRVQGGRQAWGDRGREESRAGSRHRFLQHQREEALRSLASLNKLLQETETPEQQLQNTTAQLMHTIPFPLDMKKAKTDNVAQHVFKDLSINFGLKKLGQQQEQKQQIEECFQGKKLVLDKLFPNQAPEALMKLEICSGSGEWVTRQAKEDPTSNWLSLELRRDRLFQTMTQAITARVSNLVCLGGDASVLLKHSLPKASMDFVFVNHPEPPQQRGSRDRQDAHSDAKHLLTASFFGRMHKVLKTGGTLTVTTDNRYYAALLLNLLAEKLGNKFSNKAMPEQVLVSKEKGIFKLYEGEPTNEGNGQTAFDTGVVAADAGSYFDRLWSKERNASKYFFCLVKEDSTQTTTSNEAAPDATEEA